MSACSQWHKCVSNSIPNSLPLSQRITRRTPKVTGTTRQGPAPRLLPASALEGNPTGIRRIDRLSAEYICYRKEKACLFSKYPSAVHPTVLVGVRETLQQVYCWVSCASGTRTTTRNVACRGYPTASVSDRIPRSKWIILLRVRAECAPKRVNQLQWIRVWLAVSCLSRRRTGLHRCRQTRNPSSLLPSCLYCYCRTSSCEPDPDGSRPVAFTLGTQGW